MTVKGKCSTAALKADCMQSYTTFGTEIAAKSAKKKTWMA